MIASSCPTLYEYASALESSKPTASAPTRMEPMCELPRPPREEPTFRRYGLTAHTECGPRPGRSPLFAPPSARIENSSPNSPMRAPLTEPGAAQSGRVYVCRYEPTTATPVESSTATACPK